MIKKEKNTEKPKEKKVDEPVPEVDVKSSTLDSASLKELVEKNLKWSQIIYEQNKKIKRRLTIMAIGSYLRLALILIPIIFAIFYLPPLLKNMISQYQSILGGTGGSTSGISDLLGQVSSDQLQEIIKTFTNR